MSTRKQNTQRPDAPAASRAQQEGRKRRRDEQGASGSTAAPTGVLAASSGSPGVPAERWHDADELRWAARHWAARIGVKTPLVHVRHMTTKWGSISTAGRLTLNSELLDLPKSLGEFVIVHELVHLLVPNHGRVFKSFLHAYLPDWQQREKALREQSLQSTSRSVTASAADSWNRMNLR